MLEYMHGWVNGLGHQKNEIIRRLSKQAVRNHENIRLGSTQSGSGHGSQAQHAGVQAQYKIQGYANQIPGVQQATAVFGQAQNLMGKFNTPGMNTGFGREGGPPIGGGGAPSYPGVTAHGAASPPPMTGEAASFFASGPSSAPSFPGESSYAPPSGPPPGQSSYTPPSGPPHGGYAPPTGPPPGQSPLGFPGAPPSQSGYAPSYAAAPPMSFPSSDYGAPPSFPGASTYPGQRQGEYGGGPPPPPAGFGFPGADMPHAHAHQHHHEHQHSHHHGHQHGQPQPPPGGPFGW